MPRPSTEAGLAVGVVLIHDRDPGGAEILCQVLHHRLGFLEVAGANVHHQRLVGLAQKLRASEGADEGSAGRSRDRLRGRRGRGADRAGKREHLVLFEKLLDGLDRLGRLVAVVDAFELELAALDPAGFVCLREGGLHSDLHALSERARGTAERCELTENDPVGRDAVFGGGRKDGREQHQTGCWDRLERWNRHVETLRSGAWSDNVFGPPPPQKGAAHKQTSDTNI